MRRWIMLPVAAVIALAAGVLVSHAAGTVVTGTSVTQVKIARQQFTQIANNSQGFVDIPGMSTTITVPTNTKAIILVRFSAETQCISTSAAAQSACFVRVLVNGNDLQPSNGEGADMATAPESRGMRTFERSRGPVGPGTYFVKAQMLAVANGSGVTSSIQLDLSHMTVERISA